MADTTVPFTGTKGFATGVTGTAVVDETGAFQISVVTGINGLTGDYKSLFGANSIQSTAVGLTAQLDYIAFNDFESQILSASAASNGGDWALGNANGGSATVGSTTQITNFGADNVLVLLLFPPEPQAILQAIREWYYKATCYPV